MDKNEIRRVNMELSHDMASEIKNIIEEILSISIAARNDGLLAIEEIADKCDDKYLSKMLMLVVDGIDSDLLRIILENKYFSEDRHAVDAMKRLMQMEGILMVQSGENPIIIEEILRSMLKDEIDRLIPVGLNKEVLGRYRENKKKNESSILSSNIKVASQSSSNTKTKSSSGSGMLTAKEIEELLKSI